MIHRLASDISRRGKQQPDFTSGLCLQYSGPQMKCGPNYILSDALQRTLPSEKLISECPPQSGPVTFLFQMHRLPSLLLMRCAGVTAVSNYAPRLKEQRGALKYVKRGLYLNKNLDRINIRSYTEVLLIVINSPKQPITPFPMKK